jgi:hypothetical protein
VAEPARDRFAAELNRLLAAAVPAGACTIGPPRWTVAVEPGGLPIEVELDGERARVSLAGWSRDGDPSEDGDLLLDLVGAALFGDVRAIVRSVDGQDRDVVLEIRTAAGHAPISRQGRRPGPFSGTTVRTLANAFSRPGAYAARPCPLPWAPWAGAAGFSGADTSDAPAELPVDGTLDLHDFSPRDVKPLVLEYIEQCRARGIAQLRIVHGKGTGRLRRSVHAILAAHPHVRRFALGGHGEGSWGATVVDLDVVHPVD